MSSHIRNRVGISIATFAGVALLACFIALRAHADSWDKMTRLTFSEPTQVMDTYLEPGTYMFKLANSDRHIVQIFTKDRSRLINTVFAIPAYRVNPTSKTEVSFWETPPGTARAVKTWYYPGERDGQEFRYPTNLRQIAAVTPLSFAPQAPASVQSEATGPAPAPEAFDPAPPAQQEPVVIAQNNAPPEAQPEPVEIAQNNAPPAPQPPAQPEEQPLPKMASPYPLFGLGGLIALGLYGALRVKTHA